MRLFWMVVRSRTHGLVFEWLRLLKELARQCAACCASILIPDAIHSTVIGIVLPRGLAQCRSVAIVGSVVPFSSLDRLPQEMPLDSSDCRNEIPATCNTVVICSGDFRQNLGSSLVGLLNQVLTVWSSSLFPCLINTNLLFGCQCFWKYDSGIRLRNFDGCDQVNRELVNLSVNHEDVPRRWADMD